MLKGSQIPNIYVRRPYEKSKANLTYAFLENVCGIFLDPWQKLALNDILAIDDKGQWVHGDVGLVIARQSGKSELIIARMLVALFLEKLPLTIYSAHRIDSYVKIFQRMAAMVEDNPKLMRRVKNVWRTTGRETIETRDGCSVTFRTRKSGGGRGFTADLLILDEAMAMSQRFAEDVRPTLTARPNPQVILAGSAGHSDSEHFGHVRKIALGDDPGSIAWLEWSAELCGDYCDPDCTEHDRIDDPKTWAKTNPALGTRVSQKFLASQLKTLGPEGFAIEHLSVGDWPQDLQEFSIISREAWDLREDQTLDGMTGLPVFAVRTTQDRTSTVVAVANWTNEERTHALVQITGSAQGLDLQGGTKWVVPRIVELCDRWGGCVVIDTKGQASSFIEPLEKKDVDILSPTSFEYAQACATFAVGITGTDNEPAWIFHSAQPEMTAAVAGTEKRKLTSLWAWGRATEGVDITPLEAATDAMYGLLRRKEDDDSSFQWGFGGG